MATESIMLRDGSQCVAAADYSTTGTSLLGVDSSGQYLAVYVSDDRKVSVCSDPTATFYGILQNQPKLGEAADVCIGGICKAVAGAQITVPQALMVDSEGRVVTWTAAGKNFQIGVAIEDAAGANSIIAIRLYPTPLSCLT